MRIQGNTGQPISENPLRTYARESIAVASVDQVRGVLTRRIAQRLFWQQKQLLGQPGDLDRAKPNEQHFYLDLARQVLELIDRIDRTDPPTSGEIARYESEKALILARQHARVGAALLQHHLGPFRPNFERTYEVALCERCHCGVSVYLGTAEISVSDELSVVCRPTGGSDGR